MRRLMVITIVIIFGIGIVFLAPYVEFNKPTASASRIEETKFEDINLYFYKIKDGSVTCYVARNIGSSSGSISCLQIKD